MASSTENTTEDQAHNTHQVLGLAVGLGVGIPVILVIIVLIWVTMRHRRFAREEDKRHDEIDLDAEISAAEEKSRRHRPVPGSLTYLAKQHAASQRDLSNQDGASSQGGSSTQKRQHIMSYVSTHDSSESPAPNLVYTPYATEQENSSIENLTRDLGAFDAPSYPKIPRLRSSSSSSTLPRDEWSRRTSLSEDSRPSYSAQSSPALPDRKKSQGHGAVLKLYDQYQPRFEENRRPSTLKEEEEHPRRSPFEDEDSFSFEQHNHDQHKRYSFESEAGHIHDDNELEVNPSTDISKRSSNSHDQLLSGNNNALAPGYSEPIQDASMDEPSQETVKPKPLQNSNEPASAPSFYMNPAESSNFVDAVDTADTTVESDFSKSEFRPVSHVSANGNHADERESLDRAHQQQFGEQLSTHVPPAAVHQPAQLLPAQIDTRPTSSLYEAPNTSSGPNSSYTLSSNDPTTPQMQSDDFDYHLESSPLSPSSPLHTVPSYNRLAKAGGSRKLTMQSAHSGSDYMPDVSILNQGMPRSPSSPRVRSKQHQPPHKPTVSQNTMDHSVFLEAPRKFNKNGGKRSKLPSASQLAI